MSCNTLIICKDFRNLFYKERIMSDPNDQQEMGLALKAVGDSDRYQKILMVFLTVAYILIAYMLLGSAFVFMNPSFKCSFAEGKVTEAKACQRISECYIENDFTITYYAQLYCDRQTGRNIIQSCTYIGSVAGLLLMNMLSDTKGRKLSFTLALGISVVGVFIQLLGSKAKSIAVLSIAQIVVGFGSYSALILGYSYISDICGPSMRSKAILAMNGVWALGELSLGFFYFWYPYWENFIVIAVFIPLVGLFAFSLFFLIETPLFLYSKKRDRARCIDSLQSIAMWNSKSEEQILEATRHLDNALAIGQEKHSQQQISLEDQHQGSVFRIFKSSKYMKAVLLIALVEITTNLYYYGVQFSLQQIGTNFGVNVIIAGGIEATAYFSINLFVDKLPRKKGLFLFNVGSIIIGALFLIPFFGSNRIAGTILLGFCRFVNTYSQGVIPLLQSESFTPLLQSTGWGLIEGISQIGSFLAPFLVSQVSNVNLNPVLILCLIMAIFGLLPIKFITETLKKTNPIEQGLLSSQTETQND